MTQSGTHSHNILIIQNDQTSTFFLRFIITIPRYFRRLDISYSAIK